MLQCQVCSILYPFLYVKHNDAQAHETQGHRDRILLQHLSGLGNVQINKGTDSHSRLK